MTHKSSQIRPDWIAGAICDLQSVLRLHYRAGGGGQWSPWAKVAMGTTSGCSALFFAALTHLRAELSRISLCQASFLLLYFLTLLCAVLVPSVSSPLTHRHLHALAFGHLHACWQIYVYALPQTHRTTPPPRHTHTYMVDTHKHTSLFELPVKPQDSAQGHFYALAC